MSDGSGGSGMRPIRQTIPFADALRIVREAARPLDRTVQVTLPDAAGRVLAADLVAERDVPPFDRAAMDGYAVVASDTFGAGRQDPARLRCIESVHTGMVAARRLGAGECIQIATGAPLPDGADAVVMVEETARDGAEVRVFAPVHPRQHVGRRAADIAAGQSLLHAGDLLTPSRVGSIAALGIAEVTVYDRPRVGLVSTGNEIVEPGQPLAPGQIYDINRFTLGAVVAEHGGVPVPYPITADSLPALGAAVDDIIARGADILVFSGGSSVGERDLTLDVMRRKGAVAFHGIAVKPGKPTAFGHIGQTPVLGMPGYPTSCLSNAYLLLVPFLRLVARLPPHRMRTVTVPAAHRFVSAPGRHQFYTVRIVDGTAVGAFKASGDITSMSQADGYVEIPLRTDVIEEGEPVEVALFGPGARA
ncbi:MAG: molybdopterin molybdotransferase MoeA [Acidobacteria bacterium]|nr:molybdopterin molybdotransferase MoeA [Acidobacteriota bacterium]